VQRPEDGSDVTGFGSFDNSTCKRVLDLLEPGDLRLGQLVIKRVAVVKLGVNTDILLFCFVYGGGEMICCAACPSKETVC